MFEHRLSVCFPCQLVLGRPVMMGFKRLDQSHVQHRTVTALSVLIKARDSRGCRWPGAVTLLYRWRVTSAASHHFSGATLTRRGQPVLCSPPDPRGRSPDIGGGTCWYEILPRSGASIMWLVPDLWNVAAVTEISTKLTTRKNYYRWWPSQSWQPPTGKIYWKKMLFIHNQRPWSDWKMLIHKKARIGWGLHRVTESLSQTSSQLTLKPLPSSHLLPQINLTAPRFANLLFQVPGVLQVQFVLYLLFLSFQWQCTDQLPSTRWTEEKAIART